MIRKHSAKCVRISQYGEIHHYVEVGGRYYYNGRDNFHVSISEPDGFWKQSISTIVANGAEYARHYGGDIVGKHYIRHWETNNA